MTIGHGLAVIGICALGATSMYITDGGTGIGWSVLAISIFTFLVVLD